MWLNKNKPSDNEGFYTSKVKTHKNKIGPKTGATARKVLFQDPELDTHKVRHRKGRVVVRKNAGLVLTVTDKHHHRSVLGAVAPARTKDGQRTMDNWFK